MQITFKKSELEGVLITISAYDNKGVLVSGLLSENLKLSSKRKLQKTHKSLLSYHKELLEDIKAVFTEFKDNKERIEEELEILKNETITVDIEQVSLSEIENITSETNYNFDLIEKIAI